MWACEMQLVSSVRQSVIARGGSEYGCVTVFTQLPGRCSTALIVCHVEYVCKSIPVAYMEVVFSSFPSRPSFTAINLLKMTTFHPHPSIAPLFGTEDEEVIEISYNDVQMGTIPDSSSSSVPSFSSTSPLTFPLLSSALLLHLQFTDGYG